VLTALVATVGDMPLKSKIFHRYSLLILKEVPVNGLPTRTILCYLPPAPHAEPQADLGLLSSPAPQADGCGLGSSPAPQAEGCGLGSPLPQADPQDDAAKANWFEFM